MSRLQSIENGLSSIDQAGFQNLCDSFLALRNKNYRAFSRTGSQSGKQKTVKGTPDSFLLLPDGRYIFIEYSTNVSAGISKIQDDIKKCLNEEKTGIPRNQITEIIICVNFNLVATEIEKIRSLLEETRIQLSIQTLDSLAVELSLHHRNLAHEYLGVSLDTGQIVSIDQFIDEYNRKGSAIATPLDTPYVQREAEQQQILRALNLSDFVIVTGPAGVGKTKLCIETIRLFLKENVSYEAYCISYKSHTLLDDLFQYINQEKNFVLFVDDANRIDAFSQITGFYQAIRTGTLKLVITVRDYAYNETGMLTQEFDSKRVDIPRLTDEQVLQIISSPPYEILNPDYQDPIKSIADGNPRLAIMSARLAKDEQDPRALADVSDLFEKYYASFVGDKVDFASTLNIKCLGLIAFFYTIPYKDRKVTVELLENFNISYDSFIETIDKLDQLELVEIQFNHVKIPEQNLSTYFFYKAFIGEQLLSFQSLLANYFPTNQPRFKDCVIPANNTFGSERVMNKLQPFLKSYWNTIKDDWNLGYKFLTTFWFYMEEEALTFVLQNIRTLPTPSNPSYEVKYDTNDFAYDHDEIIYLLGDFLRFHVTMVDALEVLFEYVRKKPERLPELIHKIRENLLFDRDDWRFGFQRQNTLFEFLVHGLEKHDILLTRVFFELAKTFLGFQFRHTKGGRNHSIVFSTFQLPDVDTIHKFRSFVWDSIQSHFLDHFEWAFDTLKSYSHVHPDVGKKIMQRDIPHLLFIIQQYLSPNNFEHCKYVQNQIRWCKRNDVNHIDFSKLVSRFTNPLYERYLILDWDRFRDKESFEFEDFREYEKAKEQQIRDSIKLTSKSDIEKFYEDFVYLKEFAENDWAYSNVLAIIIDETMQSDAELGYAFLNQITKNGNVVNLVPNLVLRNILDDDTHVERFWKLIASEEFSLQHEWKMAFFLNINDKLLSKKQTESLLDTIKETKTPIVVPIKQLERFIKFDSKLFGKIIRVVFEKNEQEDMRITVWGDLFSEQFDLLGDDFELIKKFYLQQRRIQNHFDYDLKGLRTIMSKDVSFIMDYISNLYIQDRHEFVDIHKGLGFVWNLPHVEEWITRVFELVRKKAWWIGIREHYCNVFFRNLEEESQSRADSYIMEFIATNYSNPKQINEIIDIVKHSRNTLLEKALLKYIELNQNPDDFSKIRWINSGGVYSGDVIVGDLRASSWKNILSMAKKSDLGIELLPIKKRINETIEGELQYADIERKRKFLDRW